MFHLHSHNTGTDAMFKRRLPIKSPSIPDEVVPYSDLGPREIRVLDVCPDPSSHSTLNCSLRHISLDSVDDDGYLAISYTWQQFDSFTYETCNSKLQARLPTCVGSRSASLSHLVVTTYEAFRSWHTASAVQSVLGYGKNVTIWIDAVCIDQANPEERGRQVVLMCETYSCSLATLVMLGHQNFQYKDFSRMRDRRTYVSESASSYSRAGGWRPTTIGHYGSSTGEESSEPHEAYRKAQHMLKHPYWRRAWILQEVITSPTVVVAIAFHTYGDMRWELLSWDELVACLRRAEQYGNISDDRQSAQREAIARAQSQISFIDKMVLQPLVVHGQQNFLEILHGTRSAECTDGRGVVYAKLGLAEDSGTFIPLLDYTIDAMTMLWQLTCRYLFETGICYMIAVADTELKHPNLPSWVPDWTKISSRHPPRPDLLHDSGDTASSPASGNGLRLAEDGRTLSASGSCFDILADCDVCKAARTPTIPHVVATPPTKLTGVPFGGELLAVIRTTAAGFRRLLSHKRDDFSFGDMEIRNFILIAAAHDGYREVCRAYKEVHPSGQAKGKTRFDHWYEQYRSVRVFGQPVHEWVRAYIQREDSKGLWDLDLHDWEGIEAVVDTVLPGRSVFGTVAGRPVLVPSTSRRGDMICVLSARPVPVILRKVDDHYILIGECCVDEIAHADDYGVRSDEAGSNGHEEPDFNIR